MASSSLTLSTEVQQRVRRGAASLRISPNEFITQLLRLYYSSFMGLPRDIVVYIISFLDYSTISSVVSLVCKTWQEHVVNEPGKLFTRLRQMHGIHLLDPVRGISYYPRALKRVVLGTGGEGTGTSEASHGFGALGQRASSFLTVDIRTQDTRTLPWSAIKLSIQRAIMKEKIEHGYIRNPSLQRLAPTPTLTQSAVATFDRHIYVAGGACFEGIVMNSVYKYNPQTKRWLVLPSLCEARACAAACVCDGVLYVMGGYSQQGEVLDTYECLDLRSGMWIRRSSGEEEAASATRKGTSQSHATPRGGEGDSPLNVELSLSSSPLVSPSGKTSTRLHAMPQPVCGAAVVPHRDVVVLIGGYQRRVGPEEVAFQQPGSTTATPMRLGRGAAAGTEEAPESASYFHLLPPPTPTRSDDPGAESWVWLLQPRTRRWWTSGPPLPSPRAFGAAVVLGLPSVGECLCYFGGCSRVGAPQTAMLYIPLAALYQLNESEAAEGSRQALTKATQTDETLEEEEEEDGAHEGAETGERSFLWAMSSDSLTTRCSLLPQQAYSGGAHTSFLGDRSSSTHEKDTLQEGVEDDEEDRMMRRYFKDPVMLPWQRYSWVPLGGAFTSVAVLGAPRSRTVVVSSSYPAPFIGLCKVNHLVAPSAFSLSLSPVEQRLGVTQGDTAPPPVPPTPSDTAARRTSPPPQLDPALQAEAATEALQERERSHHQRVEIRQLMRAAASAASKREPLNPRTAGEENTWILAAASDVRAAGSGEPVSAVAGAVTWSVQALNAKTIVGIE